MQEPTEKQPLPCNQCRLRYPRSESKTRGKILKVSLLYWPVAPATRVQLQLEVKQGIPTWYETQSHSATESSMPPMRKSGILLRECWQCTHSSSTEVTCNQNMCSIASQNRIPPPCFLRPQTRVHITHYWLWGFFEVVGLFQVVLFTLVYEFLMIAPQVSAWCAISQWAFLCHFQGDFKARLNNWFPYLELHYK